MSKLFTRGTLAAALVVTTLSGAAVAIAGEHTGGKHAAAYAKHHGDGLPKAYEALGLSDAQKAQIKALHEASRSSREAARQTDRALYESLRALSPAAPNYSAEVDRIAAAMGAAHAERVRARAALRAQQWALLTPSQQSQLAAMPAPEPKKGRWHH